MNASEMTFGVEIETIVSYETMANGGLTIGAYHVGSQVPYLPAGWTAQRDGSLSGNGVGCEIVSPVLRGEAGILQVIEVVRILRERGHKVNASCGVHVHVGWDRNLPSIALARLIQIVSYAEAGIYAITGTKSRERGHYCGGIRKYGNDKAAKLNMDANRYHVLNLVPLSSGRRNAVEFRAFSGSLNATKIVGWIQICLGLVQRAIVSKRAPKWAPAPLKGGWAKKGPGQSETERLFGFVAWAGYYDVAGSNRPGVNFGWVCNAISQEEIKSTFRRLAAQYDAQV